MTRASLIASILLFAACGSDSPGAQGTGGSGGAGGARSGGTTGGAGGMVGAGGAPADAAPADTGGETGAPTGGPAVDCTTAAGDYCIAASGTIDGKAFEVTCLPANMDVVLTSPASTAAVCQSSANMLLFRVAVPERGEGTFDVEARAAQAGSNLEILRVADDAAKTDLGSRSANMTSARIRVTGTADRLRVGDFEGRWGTADPGCRSAGYRCAEGSVRGSFRVRRNP